MAEGTFQRGLGALRRSIKPLPYAGEELLCGEKVLLSAQRWLPRHEEEVLFRQRWLPPAEKDFLLGKRKLPHGEKESLFAEKKHLCDEKEVLFEKKKSLREEKESLFGVGKWRFYLIIRDLLALAEPFSSEITRESGT